MAARRSRTARAGPRAASARPSGKYTLIAATPSALLYATLGAAASGTGTNPVTYALLPFGLVLTAIVAWRTRAHVRAGRLDPSAGDGA